MQLIVGQQQRQAGLQRKVPATRRSLRVAGLTSRGYAVFSASFVTELVNQVDEANRSLAHALRTDDAAEAEVARDRLRDLLELAEDQLAPAARLTAADAIQALRVTTVGSGLS